MRKKMLAAALTCMIAATGMIMAVPVNAREADRIEIEGASTVYVGKKLELDADIKPDDDGIRDSRIIWKSSKPSVAKVLQKRGDDTKIKGKKAGTVKITVRVKGTKLKATKTITVKKIASVTEEAKKDKKELKKYKAEIKKIFKEMKKAKISAGQEEIRSYKAQLDAIERKLDALDDKWEDLKGKTARKLEKEIDKVEDYLENAEEYLEDKFSCDDD